MKLSIPVMDAFLIRWSARGSCGQPGCTDAECCCALCGLPIGVSEEDPRWDHHDEDCSDCDLCRDQVPIMLFRGEGRAMEQAQFHTRCFENIVEFENPECAGTTVRRETENLPTEQAAIDGGKAK